MTGAPKGASSRFVRAAVREVRAFAKLARLMALDLGAVVPGAVGDEEDVVVLVHGALATAGAWRPLRERLERSGAHVASFSYGPSNGVREISDGIATILKELPEHARVHLVGHSLGGLAIRWFVQERGDARVVQTISVAAPFAGARGARLLPGPAGRDMQRGSPALEQLAARATGPKIPHLSIFGTADTAVAQHTTFPVGERMVIKGAGHNALLFDDTVAERIIARVGATRR